jgi:hypothetical protein
VAVRTSRSLQTELANAVALKDAGAIPPAPASSARPGRGHASDVGLGQRLCAERSGATSPQPALHAASRPRRPQPVDEVKEDLHTGSLTPSVCSSDHLSASVHVGDADGVIFVLNRVVGLP